MDSYWYQLSGQRFGPVSQKELSVLRDRGVISDDCLVWIYGKPGWVSLRETSILPRQTQFTLIAQNLREQIATNIKKYRPNSLPILLRFVYSATALTWFAWAALGLASGHMYFLVSKAGPIQFSGIPAIIFAGAVMWAATACMVSVVDHYDKRDNEVAYQQAQTRFWWLSASFFAVAVLIAYFQWLGGRQNFGGSLGLLSAQELKDIVTSNPVAQYIRAKQPTIRTFAGLFLMLSMLLGLSNFYFKIEKNPSGTKARVFIVLVGLVGAPLCVFGSLDSIASVFDFDTR